MTKGGRYGIETWTGLEILGTGALEFSLRVFNLLVKCLPALSLGEGVIWAS
jgi:hypothetical protein